MDTVSLLVELNKCKWYEFVKRDHINKRIICAVINELQGIKAECKAAKEALQAYNKAYHI
jgi:hypothetical protein